MSRPFIVHEQDLTAAWRAAFLAAYQYGELCPLVATISGFEGFPGADAKIVAALDRELKEAGEWQSATTASTIFPSALWNPAAPREDLYERYQRVLPKLKRVRANRRGTYFQRLIAFGNPPLNQLEFVIGTWEKGIRRRSALVASLFDPVRDHIATPMLGFPCLHQVSFAPEGGSLAVTGWYTNQYLFSRGFGNYLGLARLGAFVANAMSMPLGRVTCVASIASIGRVPKKRLQSLVSELS